MILRWGYMPNEVRSAVAPILRSYLFLVPPWCRQLAVDYWKGDGSGDAQTSCDPEYRQGHIQINAGWLDANPTQRRLEIIHELLHLPLAPMVEEHRETVDRLFDDGDAPKFKATVQEQWRKCFEGAVQDLAFAILSIPMEAMPRVDVTEEEDGHPQFEAAA